MTDEEFNEVTSKLTKRLDALEIRPAKRQRSLAADAIATLFFYSTLIAVIGAIAYYAYQSAGA